MIHRHYTDNKNLDEDLLQSIVHETDENPDELRFIEKDFDEASYYAEELMSYLIWAYICRNQNSLEHWQGEIVTFLKTFKKIIAVDRDNKNENAIIQNRVAKNLDKIYNDAMDKVFEELGYSIEDKRYKRSFFNGKIPGDIRQDFLKIISITEKDKYSNDRPIPRDISNRLRKYFGLPEQSPWRVEDFLSVNLAGYLHFGDDKWEKDSKEIETKLLSKFPKRN